VIAFFIAEAVWACCVEANQTAFIVDSIRPLLEKHTL